MNVVISILAILAGFVAVVVLSIGTDEALAWTGAFPPPDSTVMLLAATMYRSAIAVLGSYISARLAPNRPMTHALILGVIGFAAATAGAIVMWHVGNHWYPIALVVTALPCAWAGGRLAGATA